MEFKNNSGVPPDGRWGWVVVFGSFITNVFSQSLTFVFGFIYGTRFAELDFTQSNISLIMNLSSVCTNLSGWLLGIATEYFSLRQLSVVGSLSISFGIIISSFASTLPQFILSYAVMVGIGLGLTGSAAFLAVCSFFTMRRNRAVSFAMTGIGIGQILLPQIVTTLMPAYGSQGTILYIGALSLHSLIGAILFQPVKWHFIPNNRRLNLPSETDPLLPEKSREAINTNSSNNRNFVSKGFDFDVMKDIRFFILNLGLSCGYSIIIDFVTILPFFLQVSWSVHAFWCYNYFFIAANGKLDCCSNGILLIIPRFIRCYFPTDLSFHYGAIWNILSKSVCLKPHCNCLDIADFNNNKIICNAFNCLYSFGILQSSKCSQSVPLISRILHSCLCQLKKASLRLRNEYDFEECLCHFHRSVLRLHKRSNAKLHRNVLHAKYCNLIYSYFVGFWILLFE